MQELTKTTCFVVTAAVLGLAAVGNAWLSQPGTVSESDFVGKEFYPDFVTTEAARSLEVSAIDPESGTLKRFSVESDGDLWRIPTHYDYPAEAAARIAQTSASVMGLKAEAIVGMGESEFEKFGVVDPLSDDLEDPETAGKRVSFLDENGDTLVDYIIGKEIEDAVPTRRDNEFAMQNDVKDFYIRKAEDSQTFRVSLDLDLSTKFSDWIDPDLLRINRPDVTQVSINNYKIEERGNGAFGMTQLFKDQGDQLLVSRASPTDGWDMVGLNPATEEIQTDRVNEILGVLDEMVIVGVRPKFKFEGKQLLTAELAPADIEEFKTNRDKAAAAYRSLQKDLMEKGFNLGGTQEQLELVSENGEIEFGTSKGLRYRLHVGGAAAGEDESIEIGSKNDADTKKETEPEESSDDPSRFVYVRVTFDEALLGDRPAEPKLPELPVKPEGYKPAGEEPDDKGEKPEAESKDKDEDEDEDKNADATEEPEAEKPAVEERNPEFVAYEVALSAYETAKGEHEMNLTRHKQDNEAFDEKIKEGKGLVDELNQRFGDWYYVISASNLSTIQSARTDLVKPVETAAPAGGVPGMPPGISIPNIPGGQSFDSPEAKAAIQRMIEQAKAEAEANTPSVDKPDMEAETPKEGEKSDTGGDGDEKAGAELDKKADADSSEPAKEAKPAAEAEPAKESEPAKKAESEPAKEAEPAKNPKLSQKRNLTRMRTRATTGKLVVSPTRQPEHSPALDS